MTFYMFAWQRYGLNGEEPMGASYEIICKACREVATGDLAQVGKVLEEWGYKTAKGGSR